MTFTAPIVVFALAGVLLLFAAVRRLRRRRVFGGILTGATALVLLLLSLLPLLRKTLDWRQKLGIDATSETEKL